MTEDAWKSSQSDLVADYSIPQSFNEWAHVGLEVDGEWKL